MGKLMPIEVNHGFRQGAALGVSDPGINQKSNAKKYRRSGISNGELDGDVMSDTRSKPEAVTKVIVPLRMDAIY
jgi:hypothetical protein